MFKKITAVFLAVGMMVGCSTTDGPNETGGRILGGVAGALAGSQFGKGHGRLVAVGAGALLGSYIGGSLGQRMDAEDKRRATHTMQTSLERAPDYQTSTWKNPNTNHQGSFRVVKTQEYPQSNKVCRDFVHTVIIDGQEEKVHGRACRDVRDPRAHWEVQS